MIMRQIGETFLLVGSCLNKSVSSYRVLKLGHHACRHLCHTDNFSETLSLSHMVLIEVS